jgi:predicted DNA-binding protein
MSRTINARMPPRVAQKLAEYCAKSGVTRSQAVLRALEEYLDKAEGGAVPYALAVDLIPAKGAPELQSDKIREIARRAFRAPRAR